MGHGTKWAGSGFALQLKCLLYSMRSFSILHSCAPAIVAPRRIVMKHGYELWRPPKYLQSTSISQRTMNLWTFWKKRLRVHCLSIIQTSTFGCSMMVDDLGLKYSVKPRAPVI